MLLCLYGDELWCEELCMCGKLKSKLWWLSLCVHCNSWSARASTEQERRVYWLEEGEEVRDGRAERSSALTGRASSDFINAWHWWHRFWFLIGFNSILSIVLKKQSNDICVVFFFFFFPLIIDDILALGYNLCITVMIFVYHSMPSPCASKTNSASSKRNNLHDWAYEYTFIYMFESLQLEHLYVGDLTVFK